MKIKNVSTWKSEDLWIRNTLILTIANCLRGSIKTCKVHETIKIKFSVCDIRIQIQLQNYWICSERWISSLGSFTFNSVYHLIGLLAAKFFYDRIHSAKYIDVPNLVEILKKFRFENNDFCFQHQKKKTKSKLKKWIALEWAVSNEMDTIHLWEFSAKTKTDTKYEVRMISCQFERFWKCWLQSTQEIFDSELINSCAFFILVEFCIRLEQKKTIRIEFWFHKKAQIASNNWKSLNFIYMQMNEWINRLQCRNWWRAHTRAKSIDCFGKKKILSKEEFANVFDPAEHVPKPRWSTCLLHARTYQMDLNRICIEAMDYDWNRMAKIYTTR